MKSYGKIRRVEYTQKCAVIVKYEHATIKFPNPFATIGKIVWERK